MGIRIDALDAAANALADHVIPAMRSGVTSKLTLAQVSDLVISRLTASAPEALDAWLELVAQIEENESGIDALVASVATKTGVETLTNKTLTAPVMNRPVVNSPEGEFLRGYFSGLTLSNNVSDATNDIDIAAGAAGSDGATPVLMTLASALTKRLDAAWAVGTGNGGLDTGSIANTTYHVWLIQRSDTGVVDALFSASATSPTMPANYDRKAYIGPIVRASGALRAFTQVGPRLFLWTNPVLDVDLSSPGASGVLRTLTVPSGIKVRALGNLLIAAGGTPVTHYLSPPDTADVAPSLSTAPLATVYVPASGFGMASFQCVTNTSAQIRSRHSAATADVVRITTTGFELIR